ncbi:uridine kinase family protein [Agrococcus jejuensis]|uniref:Uridine kinase n=1 Tax=Agrococcus jejuensis TaxID=399736 RepID=A0A1G8H839_9MICO|nr:phosphoglycerate transporter [Agrococcus jejuensis]SDI02844.1 Uridine kinase [Agrococcus jejuensis]
MTDARLLGLEGLVARVETLAAATGRPIVVGISGVGGAGKSTLARALVDRVDGAVRMCGDDFLSPARSHERSTDWDGVERERLVRDVLVPFRERRASTFQRWDWHAGALAAPEPVPTGSVLVVDLIGLLHPEALGALDLTVWCDVDVAVATERGIARDRAAGNDHDALWRDVWVPNDADFVARFAPRDGADVLVATG